MKQVSPSVYDSSYFQKMFRSPDFSKKVKASDFSRKYQEIGELFPLTPDDHIIDYGCGNGDLCFFLNLKYNAFATGIDYSQDAVDICLDKLKKFKSKKISFLCHNNQNLPVYKNIKAIYLVDVVEHLYDSEIATILNQFKHWGTGFSYPALIIHTDNNFYLKYFAWASDLIRLLFRTVTWEELKSRNLLDRQMHVNLTTPSQLSRLLAAHGYTRAQIHYPKATPESVSQQLHLTNPLLLKAVIWILSKFPFLTPSFYAIYTN